MARKPRRDCRLYDADGHEVLVTLTCTRCRAVRPLSQFGLRRMGNGQIRSVPWCRKCRSRSTGARGRQRLLPLVMPAVTP